jgi:hypothetical protein
MFDNMVDHKKYFSRLQDAIGETKSADRIVEEPWLDIVVKKLTQLSLECAKELQQETGQPYCKYFTDGTLAYDLPYEAAPPTRLLALNLILSYWLGWLDGRKSHYLHTEPISAWKRIEEAYNNGRADYK